MTEPSKRTRLLALIAALAACAVVLTACTDEDENEGNADTRSTPQQEEGEQPLDAQANRGKELFIQNCGVCHTLEDAGTQGGIGPNLDEAQVDDEAEVLEVIRNGGRGSGNMPANIVTGADAQAVAKYVAETNPGL